MKRRRRITSCEHHKQAIKRRKTLTTNGEEEEEEERDWLDLPRDVQLLILMKLGVVDVLVNAQRVCQSWRQLSKDPSLFRSVVIQDATKYFSTSSDITSQIGMLTKQVIDRSCGQLVKFHCNDSLQGDYLASLIVHQQCTTLKSLTIGVNMIITDYCLTQLVERLPLLEELSIDLFMISEELLEKVGQCCPNLNYLRLCYHGGQMPPNVGLDELFDVEAIGIARSIPQLRRLVICRGPLTDDGLDAILVGCPLLEYLDLRGCYNLKLSGSLLKKCIRRIRTTIHPDGSIYKPSKGFTGSIQGCVNGSGRGDVTRTIKN